ncbi:MAG: methyltransferase [Kiritimatiellia bacterium]
MSFMDRERQIADVKGRAAALVPLHVQWRRVDVAGEPFDMAACGSMEVLLNALIEADPATAAVRDERLPYWTEIWPSSLVVAARALEEKSLAGRRVMDLGCGLGLAGVAAGRRGASVCFCDYDEQALRFAALNWAANVGGPFQGAVMDWREPAFGKEFDLILAADVVYEKRFFEPILGAFDTLLKPGGAIWLGEPHRPFSTGFFECLAAHGYVFRREDRVTPFPNQEKPTTVGLYSISKPP